MDLSAGNLLVLALIVVLVIVEWLYQKNKHGSFEATNKAVFGFLVFGFFYGIAKETYYLAGYCLILFVLQHIYQKVSQRLAWVLLGFVALLSGFFYLGFAYSPLFFVAVPVLLWLQIKAINKLNKLEGR